MKKFGIVASGHKKVTEIACEILKENGNAFDAVVAAGFASSILEPTLTGLAGGGFLLAHGPRFTKVYDFFSNLPGLGDKELKNYPRIPQTVVRFKNSEQTFGCDPASIAVPGTILGYLQIHKDLGSLPLETILSPVLKVAREGHPLNETQSYTLSLLSPILMRTKTGKELFETNGKPKIKGDIFKNNDCAELLELLAHSENPDQTFREILKSDLPRLKKLGCFLTNQDVDQYQVQIHDPLTFKYFDFEILSNPAPSLGGTLLEKTFELFQKRPTRDLSWGSSEHLTLVANAFSKTEEMKHLIFQKIFSRGTTHVTVSDRNGNVASMTTSNGEGSGHFLSGSGIMLNNILGEDDLFPSDLHPPYRAGTRIGSMMSPTIVKDSKGEVILALGTGGSKRIRSALFQVISNSCDFKMPLKSAIQSPRIHFESGQIQAEPGYTNSAIKSLEKLWPVNSWDEMDLYFGGVHAISPLYGGAGDPRREGNAKVVHKE